MPLGIYVSVPFCRTKCTYCNFASDVFSRALFDRYVDRVCEDIKSANSIAAGMGGTMEPDVDSIYLGGGTPTVLEGSQLERIFEAVRSQFAVGNEAEITLECAPGTLTESLITPLIKCGVNRVSLGVQSFVDQEAAAVGRKHTRATILQDIVRLRAAGITNLNIDLIAGLPHQTRQTWEFSLGQAIEAGVPHVSVYMLEVDDDSRLGRELIAGGTRYHAHYVPDEDVIADCYVAACERLQSSGIAQYEISNFAREGFESRHNLKYWTRQPYLGFGVDAHSMLRSAASDLEAVRFSTPDSLEQYVGRRQLHRTAVSLQESLEECFFLGLRLNQGIKLARLREQFGDEIIESFRPTIAELAEAELLGARRDTICLTSRGRILSNDVFERFILREEVPR